MRSPTLSELPPPPEGRTGWPWTEDSPPAPAEPLGGVAWPRVSVVMPSYRQGQFIEEAIRSNLLQGYPDYELIIHDGGSQDATLSVLEKYSPWITHWASEPDNGQSDAINRCLRRATGDLILWTNTDDLTLAGAFQAAGRAAATKGIDQPQWIIGNAYERIMAEGGIDRPYPREKWRMTRERLAWGHGVCCPAVFWSKAISQELDADLHYAMDLELWNRFSTVTPPTLIDDYLAINRIHEQTKTSTGQVRMANEFYEVTLRYGDDRLRSWLYRYGLWAAHLKQTQRPGALLPNLWRRASRRLLIALRGKSAMDEYSWDFIQ